jgi:CRP/FNR family transcriptional regulator, cyclic AMP receptor protein
LKGVPQLPESARNTKRFPKGLIYRDGDPGDEMFVIQSGQVKISKNMYGIMVAVADLGPGDAFGYMAFFEGEQRTATATAETPVIVDVYDRKAMAARIAAEPEFAFSLLREMSHRLKQVDERVADLVAQKRLLPEGAAQLGEGIFGAG